MKLPSVVRQIPCPELVARKSIHPIVFSLLRNKKTPLRITLRPLVEQLGGLTATREKGRWCPSHPPCFRLRETIDSAPPCKNLSKQASIAARHTKLECSPCMSRGASIAEINRTHSVDHAILEAASVTSDLHTPDQHGATVFWPRPPLLILPETAKQDRESVWVRSRFSTA